MAKQSLSKLLDRNLSGSNSHEKRKQKIKLARKHQKVKNSKNLDRKVKAKQTGKKEKKTTENYELNELKESIAKELASQPTYVKRQYRAQPTFEGLTPGLAPVGYDPDESDEDSEDEPY